MRCFDLASKGVLCYTHSEKKEQALLSDGLEEPVMGVWMDLFVAPKEPLPGEREPFLELVSDLLIEDLVVLPCAILGGAISVEHPLGMANAAAFFPEKARSLLIHRVDVQKMRNLLMKPSQRDAIFMEELLVIK